MTTTPRALQLKVTLKNIKPAVWRRALVSEDMTLAELHVILQVAMGWENSHLHGFTIHGQRFGPPSPDDFIPVVDERNHRIGALVHKGNKFEYEYDFGDGWEHTILVEAVREPTATETVPSCLDGKRACPPEDCGGAWGYADLLDALADPKSERHEELREWVGGEYDAERLELAVVNESLAELVRPRRQPPRSKRKRSRAAKGARANTRLH
jgi:hypothetical protein